MFSSFFEDRVLWDCIFVNNVPYRLGYNPARRIESWVLNNFIHFSKHLNWLGSKSNLSVCFPAMGNIICLDSDILSSVVLLLSMSFMQVIVISKRDGKNYTQNLDVPPLWLSSFLDFYPPFPLTVVAFYSIFCCHKPEKLWVFWGFSTYSMRCKLNQLSF